MSAITSQIEVGRSSEEVFAYITDPSHFAEWQDDVVEARMERDRPPGVGSRFTTIRRAAGREQVMTQEVTATAPPTSWTAHGIDGPVRPNVELTIEPLDGNTRSRITVVMDFEGHGIGKLLVPLVVRRQAARHAPESYRHLKERLEQS